MLITALIRINRCSYILTQLSALVRHLFDIRLQRFEKLCQRISTDQPDKSRAVILFTDGVDETSEGQRCSINTLKDVVEAARKKEVPIYTIGLCGNSENDPCNTPDNVDGELVKPLDYMSSQTNALSESGDRSKLYNLFEKIMAGLTSQWVAQASVFANQGRNDAQLWVKLKNSDLTETC